MLALKSSKLGPDVVSLASQWWISRCRRYSFVVRTLEPVWLDGRLLLVRRIARDGRESLQVVELDDGALRSWLLEQVGDHFSSAWLVPDMTLDDSNASEEDPGHKLAMLPYRLLPGAVAAPPDAKGVSSTRFGVLLALLSLLFAGLGTVAIVVAAMRVARQRSAFASAVIHELRTPLTTFRSGDVLCGIHRR